MRHSLLRGLLVLALLTLMLSSAVPGEAVAGPSSIVTIPSAFDFGYVTVGRSVSEYFPLTNASVYSVQITDVSLADWPGSLTLALPLTLRPGESVVAGPLTFAPAATGRYSSAIELTTDDPASPLVAVPVAGKALAASPTVVAIPSAFDFGYVTVGESVSELFMLKNVSAQPVQITDAVVAGRPGFPGVLMPPLAVPLTLQPGEVVQAGPLIFRPTASGWYSSAIELTTDDPSSSLVAVPVSGEAAFPAKLTRGPLPSVAAYGATVEVTGTLTDSSGTGLADRIVVLETSTNGSSWSRDQQVVTSSAGALTCSLGPLTSARYVRARFEGDAAWAPAVSTAALVKPRASLGAPVAPATMALARVYAVYGSLAPTHTAGTSVGKLYCYRLESGRWILRKTCIIRAYTAGGQGRYRASVALPRVGRWRLRAYHSDAGHAPTYSGWRYVTVR